jgi:2-polyprenyl-6-hydroxyphenyl methylase/3-demethylubiquinone-9 3-methyltransferase
MPKSANLFEDEIEMFDQVAETWWDPKGEMGSLHSINPLRMEFIQKAIDLNGATVLDVGCGGGILSEAMAKAGARVVGIDLSESSIKTAREHARKNGLQIEYRLESLEDTIQKEKVKFDTVTCMEMLEHVPEPERILADCGQVLEPGGHLFCSSINRTPKAWLFAIVGGEYILRLLPRGSHHYRQLIRPSELITWAKQNRFEFANLASLMYNIFTRKFHTAEDKEDVNYIAHFVMKTPA